MLQIWTSLSGESSSALVQWDPSEKMNEKELSYVGRDCVSDTHHWHLKYEFVTLVNS